MRAVIQRVKHAKVEVEKKIVGEIKTGLLVFVGIEDSDTEEDKNYLAQKIVNLRIFNDRQNVMNLSILDIDGEILCISQFTLMAITQKGNRPSYIRASKGSIAMPIYEDFCKKLSELLKKEIKKGIFGADMQIMLQNDGPTTIWMDSKSKAY